MADFRKGICTVLRIVFGYDGQTSEIDLRSGWNESFCRACETSNRHLIVAIGEKSFRIFSLISAE